ncbi:MAG: DUF2306 domain-containing protein [Rhizobiaceae bacterium]
MPILVLTVYAALIVWAVLLITGLRKHSFRPFLLFGVGLMLFLNIGYFVNGIPASIASFIGIYDVLINLGLAQDTNAAAISNCPDNACTVWGDRFVNHPAWGAAFYARFANGPEFRSTLLYGHIGFNSIAFVLMHFQLFRPGYGENRTLHQLVGRVTFASLTLSVICATWLASQHGSVSEYGGLLAQYGFYSMAACVYACAVMGILKARAGDTVAHRIWMFRFIGSMWGSFWLFRVMLFVIDPMLRNYEAAAILTCIWGSAPLGIVIGDMIRRRLDQPRFVTTPATAPPAE